MAKVDRCGAEVARQQLPSLLERARRGHSTVITRRGEPCAVLVPIADAPGARHAPSLLSLRGSGKGLWGRRPTRAIAAMRDEWE